MSTYQNLALELASGASSIRLRINGTSMAPLLQAGEAVVIRPIEFSALKKGDLVVFRDGQQMITHRIVHVQPDALLTLGDNLRKLDPPVTPEMILGRVIGFERSGRNVSLLLERWTYINKLLAWLGWQMVAHNRSKLISTWFRVLFYIFRKTARILVSS